MIHWSEIDSDVHGSKISCKEDVTLLEKCSYHMKKQYITVFDENYVHFDKCIATFN